VLDDLAVELDRPQLPARPVGELVGTAGVNAGAARLDRVRLDPSPAGQRNRVKGATRSSSRILYAITSRSSPGTRRGAAALQEVVAARRRRERMPDGAGNGSEPLDPWGNAPAPAKLARMTVMKLGGRDVPPERITLFTNAVHWSYGTLMGSL
jgi:hypothetical protein